MALIREIEDANAYVAMGRRLLAEISHVNTFYAGPLLMYAYGFERLMKAALLLRRWEVNGNVPAGRKIRALRHDVSKLRQEFVQECFADDSMLANEIVKKQFAADKQFLEGDHLFDAFIQTLSAFGTDGRYYHLNVALALNNASRPPDEMAKELERKVADAKGISPPKELTDSLDGYYRELGNQINVLAERLHRAIARLFLWGVLGSRGKQSSAADLQDIAVYGWKIWEDRG